MKLTFRASLYPVLRDAVQDAARDLCVLAAPCSKAREAFLLWLLGRSFAQSVGQPDAFLWVSSNAAADRRLVETWLAPLGDRLKPRGGTYALPNGSELFLADASDGTDYERLPLNDCLDAVVSDADRLPDPSAWVAQRVRGSTRFLGAFPPPGHWLHALAESGRVPCRRVTAEDAVAGGVALPRGLDQVRASMSAARYAREYEGQYQQTGLERLRFNVFARRRLQIRDKQGNVIPFRLRSIQRTYLAMKQVAAAKARAEGRPLRFILLKYRRGGFTTLEQGLSYQLCATRENMSALTLAHKREATATIFRIARLMHAKDPLAPRIRGVGNSKRLDFPDLNSLFTIGTAGGTGEGRGDTLQRVHGSEVSKWDTTGKRAGLVNDLVAGLSEAASEGEMVLESTPNGREWFFEAYQDAKKNQNSFTPMFLPWFWDPSLKLSDTAFSETELRDTLDDEERDLIQRHKLTLSQIAWRRVKRQELRGLFRQEYVEDDGSCFLTEGLCYFTASTLFDLLEALPPYEVTAIPGGYEVVWEEPQPDEEYVLGADTSEGVPKSDPNGLGILKKRTGEQVAEVHGVFRPAELAAHVRHWAARYNGALAAIERNNHGHAVLEHSANPEDPLYCPTLYYAEDGRPGWVTSPKTRPVMLSELKEAVEDGHMLVRSQQLLQEMVGFVKQRSGKYEGKPDDAVFKWSIAWQARQVEPPVSDVRWLDLEQ
jgi:hypothetical protein